MVGLDSTTLADTGRYTCRVTNRWGEAECQAIRLRVLFRVIYDGNSHDGGTVPVDTNGYEPGALASPLVSSGNLVKSGYTFIGWNTAPDGSGENYAPNTNFTIDSRNVTLTRIGHTFYRWNTDSTGNGEDYQPGDKFYHR